MKLWGKVLIDNKIRADRVVAVHAKTAYDVEDWNEPFYRLCHELNLSRPVILSKHVRDLEQFRRTVFRPEDFVEPVEFDKFEAELF